MEITNESQHDNHLIFRLLLLTVVCLLCANAKAQIVTTEDGDTAHVGKDFKLEAESPLFLSENGLLTDEKITPEVYKEAEDLLYNSTDLKLWDYINLAYLFSNDENRWPLTYRCIVTSHFHARLLLDTSLVNFPEDLINTLDEFSGKETFLLSQHLENDSALIAAQLDSVSTTFQRMDYLGDIYNDDSLGVMDKSFIKPHINDVLKNIKRHKRELLCTSPEKIRLVRAFVKNWNANRNDANILDHALKPYISTGFAVEADKSYYNKLPKVFTNTYCPPKYWEGWSADDKTRTFITPIDDNVFIVVLTPEALQVTNVATPIEQIRFVVLVCLPTDIRKWRVNEVRTVERHQEITQTLQKDWERQIAKWLIKKNN